MIKRVSLTCFFIFVLLLNLTIIRAYANESADILSKLGAAMADISAKVKPSVVNISTTRVIKSQPIPFFDDPFFRRFFGDAFQTPSRKITNLGSGVIVSADGYIVTNNHVIEGADPDGILVKLHDNKELKGKVVGMDSRTDLAIIKIESTNLPVIIWGDSDKIRVGEVVLAVGNPFGLSQTITMGIVSGVGRSGIGITDYEDFIQTDAAINPGNSGGALVNVKGELVGINTAILSRSGGYQGIGFAIPSSMVRNVMESILNKGKVVRGFLGVTLQPTITPEIAKQFNLKDTSGVLIADVTEGSPADKAGIKRGDVIIEFDGKKIENGHQFRNLVAATKPGKTVTVKLVRDEKIQHFEITVGEQPVDMQSATPVEADNALKGVTVNELNDEMLRKLGITRKIKGVIVHALDPESPAASVLLNGDIIIEINKKPITSLKDYQTIVSGIDKKQDILLVIIRSGIAQYKTIPALSQGSGRK